MLGSASSPTVSTSTTIENQWSTHNVCHLRCFSTSSQVLEVDPRETSLAILELPNLAPDLSQDTTLTMYSDYGQVTLYLIDSASSGSSDLQIVFYITDDYYS